MSRQIVPTHYERMLKHRLPVDDEAGKLLDAHSFKEAIEVASQRILANKASPILYGRIVEQASYRMMDPLGPVPFCDMCDVIQTSDVHKLVSTMFGADKESEISTSYMQQWQIWRFKHAGKQVYEVSEGLASQARYTELRGVTTDMLLSPDTLPYDSVYVMVPGVAGLSIDNAESGWHTVEGVYVTRDAHPDGTPAWRIMAVGTPKRDEYDDALFHFMMPLAPGQSLDKAVDSEMERVRARAGDRYFSDAERRTLDMIPQIFKWVMNIIIYATSFDVRKQQVWNHPDAERLLENARKHPKGHKRDRAQQAVREANLMRRTLLGGGLKLMHAYDNVSEDDKRTLTVRTLVQGHWRNQAHGVGRALRKLLWIQPHWRGPDSAPVSQPVHVLR